MNRWSTLCVALLLTGSLTGCCYRGGHYDQCTGISYGGWWEPCCWNILDPFTALFRCGRCHNRCRGPVAGPIVGHPAGPVVSPGADNCGCGACSAPGFPMPAYPSGPEPVPHFAPGPGAHFAPGPVIYEGAVHGSSMSAEAAPVPDPLPPAPAAADPQSFYLPQSVSPGQMVPTQDARGQRWIPARL